MNRSKKMRYKDVHKNDSGLKGSGYLVIAGGVVIGLFSEDGSGLYFGLFLFVVGAVFIMIDKVLRGKGNQ